jgi:hypothetical protein
MINENNEFGTKCYRQDTKKSPTRSRATVQEGTYYLRNRPTRQEGTYFRLEEE